MQFRCRKCRGEHNEREREKRKKRLNPALYVIGSLAVAAVMAVAMPLIIESGSDLIVKKTQKPLKPIDDEDWGPEIVKKTRGNF